MTPEEMRLTLAAYQEEARALLDGHANTLQRDVAEEAHRMATALIHISEWAEGHAARACREPVERHIRDAITNAFKEEDA